MYSICLLEYYVYIYDSMFMYIYMSVYIGTHMNGDVYMFTCLH